MSSIAADYGVLCRTVVNDPANAELLELRKDPNVLFPGDVVIVGEKEIKEEDRPTEARHKFKVKEPPTHIRIRLLIDDTPRANERYELDVMNQTIAGTTDGSGFLQAFIPPAARVGVLKVGSGPNRDVYELGFGTLDPIDTEDGVRKRLEALNFAVDDAIEPAVRAFQEKQHLAVTGDVDDATRNKLKEVFGQ